MGFVPKGTSINALLKPMICFSKGKNVDHVNYDKTFPELRDTESRESTIIVLPSPHYPYFLREMTISYSSL